MAEYIIIERQEMENIADAIRRKTGSIETMKISEMPAEIDKELEDAEEMEF